MTKTVIQAGPCRFETRVTAEASPTKKKMVKLHVDSDCPNIQKLVAGMDEEYDAFKLCMSRPGQDAIHEYAKTVLPPHAACPVICGILRTIEAERGLCVKADMSVTFVEE